MKYPCTHEEGLVQSIREAVDALPPEILTWLSEKEATTPQECRATLLDAFNLFGEKIAIPLVQVTAQGRCQARDAVGARCVKSVGHYKQSTPHFARIEWRDAPPEVTP